MHVLAIAEQGTQVHVEGELLLLSRGGRVVRRRRLAEISQVLLFGRVELRACESNLGLRIIREKATSPFRREQERATFFFDGIHNPTTASASHRRPPATHPDHAPGKPP